MVYLGKTIQREMYFGAKPDLFILAKKMRKNPTVSERVLWNILRKFRAEGFIFRQQHPIDIFIADFYCHKLKLVIEVDGGIHLIDQARKHDDGRSAELEKLGIRIMRFTNDQVLKDQAFVLNQINKYITEAASPALLGAGDGRG